MAAPQMMVNAEGFAIGSQIERVIFPRGNYVGEQVSKDFQTGSVQTAIFHFNWIVSGGANNFDLLIDVKDPVSQEWWPWVAFNGILTGPGKVTLLCDPTAVQADFDAGKTLVKRVRIPNRTRVRIMPVNQTSQEYSLGVTVRL
jgi:hypothetical protein